MYRKHFDVLGCVGEVRFSHILPDITVPVFMLHRALYSFVFNYCQAYYILMLGIEGYFFLNNQPDALIIQIYSVIKLYMFRASSLPIIRSFLLYIRHW